MSGTVYLIHFERPYEHARHYLGHTEDLAARLQAHRSGNGARLMEVVTQAGIDWTLVRTWEGSRDLERKLKAHKHAPRLCPICNPEGWESRGNERPRPSPIGCDIGRSQPAGAERTGEDARTTTE